MFQGGASVAFPIMTLAFGIVPLVARDFSFMIQSAGMTAAAATIVIMQVQVEMHSLLYATAGGIFGIILGLEEVCLFFPSLADRTRVRVVFCAPFATCAVHDARFFVLWPRNTASSSLSVGPRCFLVELDKQRAGTCVSA